MFSVILPVFNKEKYISKAIASIGSQTFSDFELIVINDGSTDNSLFVVQEQIVKLNRPYKVFNQQNQGVSVARNTGVRQASYEYITFLDADDWWHPEYLSNMHALIQKFPEAGIYGSRYFWVKNGFCRASVNSESETFEGYMDYIKAYTYKWWMPLHAISVVIPKKVFLEMNGFKAQLRFGEDFDLWIRIVLKHKLAYKNIPLAYYNQDVESAYRALGGKKWKKEEHYVFNLDYLVEEERRNPRLKYLLDGLRLRSLFPFHLRGDYPSEIHELIGRIDFSRHPNYYYWLYHAPRMLVKAYIASRKSASIVKQYLQSQRILE